MAASGNRLELREESAGPITPVVSVADPVPPGRQEQFRTLCDQLRDGTPEEQQNAARALWRFGRAAVEPLAAAADTGPEAVRQAAAETLGRIGDPQGAPALKVLLGERPNRRRLRFRRGMAQLSVALTGWAVFFGACAWLLEARLTGILSLAVGALSLLGFGVSRPRLGSVRGAALDALQKIAERSCPASLVSRLRKLRDTAQNVFGYDDALWDVAEEVVRHLEEPSASGEVAAAYSNRLAKQGVAEFNDETQRKLRATEKKVVALHTLANSGEAALEARAQLEEEGALETLHSALVDEEPRVQITAANRLGEQKDPRSVEPLVRALHDKNLLVRVAAAEALGQLEDERAIGPLQDALRRGFVRNSARLQKVAGQMLLLVACVMLWAFFFSRLSFVRFLGLMMVQLPLQFALPWFLKKRDEGRLVQVAAESLAWIGESSPSPRLRAVLDDLTVLSGDRLQQDASTRRACREAAARIREMTDRIEALPVPVDTEQEPPCVLPVPSEGTPPSAVELPRVPKVYR